MLLGKPVIATGWSGNMDFMDNTNAMLVPYTSLRPSTRVAYLHAVPGALWAEPIFLHGRSI